MKFSKKKLSILLFLLLILVISFSALRKVQNLKRRAEEVPVVINIDGAGSGTLFKIWQGFSQGGEEKEKMIEPVKNEIKALSPSYIRIDHIFDFYNLVSRDSSGQITYNWNELDSRVQEILEVGAIPFLSLSYCPTVLCSSSIDSVPESLGEWENLIKATIEHYSGKEGKNISGVYYEVWNEPDLFGRMNPKQYFQLYLASARGAAKANNTNFYKLGGPATIGVNRTWMNDFLGKVSSTNTRFDFISWHSYGTNPKKIRLESELIDSLENFQPFKGKVKKIISEWGSDSEMNPIHDSYFDASHTLAAVSQSLGAVDQLLAFELKDGLDPNGSQFWGRWGLLTHQKVGVVKKPRYFAFTLLNQLEKFLLPIFKDSQNVYTLASTDGLGNYSILTTFFPSQGKSELKNLTLKINNFLTGEFVESITFLDPNETLSSLKTKFTSNGPTWEKNLSLKSYSSVLITLKRVSSAITKTAGASNEPNDKAGQVVSPLPPLIYPLFSTQQEEPQSGEISFWLKPSWDGNSPEELFFFETRFSPSMRLYAVKRNNGGVGSQLEFIWEQQDFKKVASLDIAEWKKEQWYQVSFAWDNSKMELVLKVGEKEMKEALGVISRVVPGKFLYLGSDFEGKKQVNADIDNLQIKINNKLLFEENFN